MFDQPESEVLTGGFIDEVSGHTWTGYSFSLYGNTLTRQSSRFHWPSNISCSIATAVLEDRDFVESFLQKSRRLLRSQRDLAAQALEEAGIPYAQGG
jgi:DNA-binding transcriptional MocR family regulator